MHAFYVFLLIYLLLYIKSLIISYLTIYLSCLLEVGTEFIWVNFGAIMEFHSRGPIQLGACVQYDLLVKGSL